MNLINNWMPFPNSSGAQNYAGVTGEEVIIDQFLTRIDHYADDNDQFTFHYIYSSRDFPVVSLNPYFSSNHRTFPNTEYGIPARPHILADDGQRSAVRVSS